MIASNREMGIRKEGGISYGACFGSMVEVGFMNFLLGGSVPLNSPSTQCGGRKGTWAWNQEIFLYGHSAS